MFSSLKTAHCSRSRARPLLCGRSGERCKYRRERSRGGRGTDRHCRHRCLRLHGNSVREVVERLAARDLPFIFYTGQTETPTAASWPSVPFLAKPLPAGQVVDMLARVVSAKAGLSSGKNEMRDPV